MKLIDLYNKVIEGRKSYSKKIKIDNLFLDFWKNGNLECIGNWKNGKEHGEWKWFDENGSLIGLGNWP